MNISEKIEGGAAIFSISGRLDTMTAPELQAKLIPAFEEHPNIVLDMENILYVSSAGLRILLMAQKTASAKKGSFTLRGVSNEIMDIFRMTGLDNVLTIK